MALAGFEAEVAVAVADDAAGFPIAFGAGRFDFELPILAEIIEGDEIAASWVAVVKKVFPAATVGFVGEDESRVPTENPSE